MLLIIWMQKIKAYRNNTKINNELEEFEPQRKEDLRNMFIFEVLCLLFGIGLCYGGINMIIHTNNFFCKFLQDV